MSEDQHEHGAFQVVMLDVMMPGLREWLASRSLRLFRMPPSVEEGDLATYGVALTPETWENIQHGQEYGTSGGVRLTGEVIEGLADEAEKTAYLED